MVRENTTRSGVDRRTFLQGIGATGLAVSTAGCAMPVFAGKGFPPKKSTTVGERSALGEGSVEAFATNRDGKPVYVGVSLTEDALSGLTTDPTGTHLHLSLPDNPAGFEWVGVDWNPAGHPPAGIYDLPHFDFHFYTLTEETVGSIEGGPATYDIPDELLPEGYVRVPEADTDGDGTPDSPLVFPGMGEHLVDPKSPEFPPEPETFTNTFIWGAYDPALVSGESDGTGELIFAEPMITKAYLEEQHEEDRRSIGMPQAVAEAGYLPTEYVVRYVESQQRYVITLESFEWFEA